MINRKIICLILICFIAIFLTSCTKNSSEIDSENQSEIITLSPKAIEKAKIKSEEVIEKEVESTISSVAQIKSDEDLRYVLSSNVAGKIIKDNVKLGDVVDEGMIVALIENPEVIKINASALRELHENNILIRQAQNKYILAKSNLDREENLYKEGISAKKDLLEAKTNMMIAKDDVENLKRRNADIQNETRELLKVYNVKPNFNSNSISSAAPVKAIKKGIVTKKNVTLGAIVSPEEILYEIQDLNNLWLDINLYSNNINNVKLNQKITFTTEGAKDKVFEAKIDYIQPLSNNISQTFLVRAFIDNKDGLLKPGMSANVVIKNDVTEQKPFVPLEAVQQYGREYFVFLDLGNNKYQKITVELGEKTPDGYYINSGIKAGDNIVVKGSFTLKAELFKNEFNEED